MVTHQEQKQDFIFSKMLLNKIEIISKRVMILFLALFLTIFLMAGGFSWAVYFMFQQNTNLLTSLLDAGIEITGISTTSDVEKETISQLILIDQKSDKTNYNTINVNGGKLNGREQKFHKYKDN